MTTLKILFVLTAAVSAYIWVTKGITKMNKKSNIIEIGLDIRK